MNIVKRIQQANTGRDPERLVLKYRALRASPFAFFRGTCHLFYDRLAETGNKGTAPLVWCCGDLHLQNFGSYKGENRLAYFDINDFDEAALAPATWELVRLAASIDIVLQALDVPRERIAALVADMIGDYARTLANGKAGWIERDTAQGAVRGMLDQLRERSRVDFLDSRTRSGDGQRRLMLDGRKALAVTDAERALVTQTVNVFAASQPRPDFFRVIDVARRIAGTGSLGMARYVVLVEGNGSPDRNYLLDLKHAQPSTLAGLFPHCQPRWRNDAERITRTQQRMQAVTAAFLHPITHVGEPFVLRALQPSEDRLPFDTFKGQNALFDSAVRMMARCTAWAQLRSSGRGNAATADDLTAFATKKKWQHQMAQTAGVMAAQVMADWAGYVAAYDTGSFEISTREG